MLKMTKNIIVKVNPFEDFSYFYVVNFCKTQVANSNADRLLTVFHATAAKLAYLPQYKTFRDYFSYNFIRPNITIKYLTSKFNGILNINEQPLILHFTNLTCLIKSREIKKLQRS